MELSITLLPNEEVVTQPKPNDQAYSELKNYVIVEDGIVHQMVASTDNSDYIWLMHNNKRVVRVALDWYDFSLVRVEDPTYHHCEVSTIVVFEPKEHQTGMTNMELTLVPGQLRIDHPLPGDDPIQILSVYARVDGILMDMEWSAHNQSVCNLLLGGVKIARFSVLPDKISLFRMQAMCNDQPNHHAHEITATFKIHSKESD